MEPGNHFWGQPSRRNELLAVVLWTPGFYTHPQTQHCLLPYWTLLLTQLTGWGRTGYWRREKERSRGHDFIRLSGVLNEQFVSILNVALKFWGKKYFKICFYFYFLIRRGYALINVYGSWRWSPHTPELEMQTVVSWLMYGRGPEPKLTEKAVRVLYCWTTFMVFQ